jgi:hypothetical protein
MKGSTPAVLCKSYSAIGTVWKPPMKICDRTGWLAINVALNIVEFAYPVERLAGDLGLV